LTNITEVTIKNKMYSSLKAPCIIYLAHESSIPYFIL
jgi:hypothetical protein